MFRIPGPGESLEPGGNWYQLRIVLELWRTNVSDVSDVSKFLKEVEDSNLVLALPSCLLALVLALACLFLLYSLARDQPRFLLPCLLIWPVAVAFRLLLLGEEEDLSSCLPPGLGHTRFGVLHPAVVVRNTLGVLEVVMYVLVWPVVFLRSQHCV